MNSSKRTFINLTKRDIGLVLGIGTLAAILNVYPYPLVVAAAAAIAVLLLRFSEAPEVEQNENQAPDDRTIEKRSAEEIITEKLKSGSIEKAIDERFDKMIHGIVDDLFGDYGDVSRRIKDKLKETMNPYIEKYDFSEHAVKLEHLLNEIAVNLTKEQNALIQNLRGMMGTEPLKEIKTSELFDAYTKYLGENIETDSLEIDYDDEPTYRNLTAEMQCEDKETYSKDSEKKIFTLTCEEDKRMALRVVIRRWTDMTDKSWTIESIERINGKSLLRKQLDDAKDLTTLETPVMNLRELNGFEVYLLKLYYDRAAFVLDETDILDEDVEVEAKPECYFE
ncbi:hypothetical protein [Metabacillus sp. SLBN-84]